MVAIENLTNISTNFSTTENINQIYSEMPPFRTALLI